ncbi:ATP-binding protein [Candidatus Omnitrophota bacterium]
MKRTPEAIVGQQRREIDKLKKSLSRADEEIEKLSKTKSDFISVISHELRTPLTSIKESVSLVLDGLAGPLNESQKRFLNVTKSNIDRLAKIIIEILDFSKLETGRIMMHKRKMDVDQVIKESCLLVKDNIEKRNLKLNFNLADGDKITWFDPGRIGQVLNNLISNAIKFNMENGSIDISSSREKLSGKEVIKISIEDTGEGILKEDIAGLFNSFNPLDSSITRRHPGVGLGLTICRNIIELHGGNIWVESEKGIGSKFSFTLPVYKKDEEFNFLLDEMLARARYIDSSLSLIACKIKKPKDVSEDNYLKLENLIRSTVRGPEDKVARFMNGRLVAIMAGSDREGAMKILNRLKEKVDIDLDCLIIVYPDEAKDKKDLLKKVQDDLKI